MKPFIPTEDLLLFFFFGYPIHIQSKLFYFPMSCVFLMKPRQIWRLKIAFLLLLGIMVMNVTSQFGKATPPTYHIHNRTFPNNSEKEEFYPLYCKTNDSLGIHITHADTNSAQLTFKIVNQTNHDLWVADQLYSPILTWHGPEQLGFREVIIPADGYYFLVGWNNDTENSCSMIIEIIHAHASSESPTIINNYENNTFNVYDSEDPLNSDDDTIAFGWEFVIVAGVAMSVVLVNVRNRWR